MAAITVYGAVMENIQPGSEVLTQVVSTASKTPKFAICLDRALAARLEPVQLFPVGEQEFRLTTINHRRLAAVYEYTGTITQRTDYKVKANRVRFENAVTGAVLCVPHGQLEVHRLLAQNPVVELWLASDDIYSYRDLTLSCVNAFTGATEGLEFSLSVGGPWTATLTSAALPESFFVRLPSGVSLSAAASIRVAVTRFL